MARYFERLATELPRIQSALGELGVDAWLLYERHANNPVAAGLLGQTELTRRYFVLIPRSGEPTVVLHGMEEAAWSGWRWRRRAYVGWQDLKEALSETLAGLGTVAMEVSQEDAVPIMDLVPAGVVELVSGAGVRVVSSADLVTRFHARWTVDGLASHRRAAAVLAEVAAEAFGRAAETVGRGGSITESALRGWVVDQLAGRGCGTGAGSIVAVGANSAQPHYDADGAGAPLQRGDVLLLDLWAKETDEAIYADQTWMAYLGERVPAEVAQVWSVVREARDAVVDFVRGRWQAGEPIGGFEADDVTRRVIAGHGYGASFIHRTGHSIDQATHGMGPNLDNFETRELRSLVEGIGFSVEPGVYLPGRFGIRSEINVYMGPDGPEVTTPSPQIEMPALLG